MRSDAEQNKQKILKVANEVFSIKESDEVTMAQLAKAAGVGIGTLYRNFPTKGDLFLALAYDQLDEYIDSQTIYLKNHSVNNSTTRHILKEYINFREHRYQLLPVGSLESAHRYYQREDYKKLVDLFKKLIQGSNPQLDNKSVTFKADMLIAFLRGDSYGLQRDVRGLTGLDILDEIMRNFF